MLDWLIVGGGPHGVHAAIRLIAEAKVDASSIRILDDEPELLARWRRTTRNTGMRYLRSPGVHHLDVAPSSLMQFARRRGRRIERPFTRPYDRPSLELFDRHCDDVLSQYKLAELHVQGRATGMELTETGTRVTIDGAESKIEAKHIVLALGAPREPMWPDWALEARSREDDDRVRHVFDPGFDLSVEPGDTRVAVVGAGITGAQTSLRFAAAGHRVTLISRHDLRISQFDSDPGWQGPKFMTGYARVTDLEERRAIIGSARQRGSVPPEVKSAVKMACKAGQIDLVVADVQGLEARDHGLQLDLGERSCDVDRVLLATGFPGHRPGGEWLDACIEAFELPCSPCGYPVVDRWLRWHPNVFVTGPLAELELGPVARNISGARRAADRIVDFAASMLGTNPDYVGADVPLNAVYAMPSIPNASEDGEATPRLERAEATRGR